MKIIIPMSGFGERFRNVGYKIPKPLIEIDGKPLIEHVYNMFSKNDEFVFICNEEHLINKDYNMASKIKSFCTNGEIISIPKHNLRKLAFSFLILLIISVVKKFFPV